MFSVLCNLEINVYMSNGTAQIYCLLNSYCFKLFWWPLFVFLVGKYCIELLTLFLMLQRVLSNSKSDVHFEFMKLWVWLQSTSNDFFWTFGYLQISFLHIFDTWSWKRKVFFESFLFIVFWQRIFRRRFVQLWCIYDYFSTYLLIL